MGSLRPVAVVTGFLWRPWMLSEKVVVDGRPKIQAPLTTLAELETEPMLCMTSTRWFDLLVPTGPRSQGVN